METLLDYLPGASVSLDHQADEVLAARLEMIEDHYAARRLVPRDGEVPYRPLPPERLYLDRDGWDAMLAGGPLFAFSPFARPDGAVGVDGGGRPGPVFFQSGGGPGTNVFEQLRGQAERWGGEGRRIVVAAWTRGSRERLANLLREHGFKDPAQEDGWAAIRRKPAGSLSLVTLGVERGFVADRTRTGGRAGPAGRAHQPAAAAAQARRPVHRGGDGDRRGRSGRASGIRHRPLRRAGDADRHRMRRTTACG